MSDVLKMKHFLIPLNLSIVTLHPFSLQLCQLLQITLRFHGFHDEIRKLKMIDILQFRFFCNATMLSSEKKLKFHVVNFLPQFNDVNFQEQFSLIRLPQVRGAIRVRVRHGNANNFTNPFIQFARLSVGCLFPSQVKNEHGKGFFFYFELLHCALTVVRRYFTT